MRFQLAHGPMAEVVAEDLAKINQAEDTSTEFVRALSRYDVSPRPPVLPLLPAARNLHNARGDTNGADLWLEISRGRSGGKLRAGSQ
jgi:hypothetical protein